MWEDEMRKPWIWPQGSGGRQSHLLCMRASSGGARGLKIRVHGGAPDAKKTWFTGVTHGKNRYLTKKISFSQCPMHPQAYTWIRPCV
jgi:hypothetical protein